MIYSPSEDSFLLEKEVRKKAKNKKVLDVGTGSGIQALAALESEAKEVLATDIDDESIRHCKRHGINVIKSRLFEKVKGKFDLIIFNPPYLPEDEDEDSESARATSGGKKGDEIITDFLEEAKEHLSKKGEILLVVSSLTPKEKVHQILKQKKFQKTVLATEKHFMETLEVWQLS
jgi:release factor glutamine methyltransferase